MPMYEYVCEKDGTVIELLRPMAEADRPVPDPEGRGRVFKRRMSTFAAGGETAGRTAGGTGGAGGCCPCGKNRGSCGAG